MSHQRWRIRDPDRLCLSGAEVLDHRLLQEWALQRCGPLPEATEWRSRLVDVEGRDEDDTRALADRRLVRLLRDVANVFRSHLVATSP